MLDYETQQQIMNDINRACTSISYAMSAVEESARELVRDFNVIKPRIFLDGDMWCALYGDDLQVGVAGFGDSPAKASYAFDVEWNRKVKGQDDGN